MTTIKRGSPSGALILRPGGLFEGLPKKFAAAPTIPNTTLNTRPSQWLLPKLLQALLFNPDLTPEAKKLLAEMNETVRAIIKTSDTIPDFIRTMNNVATVLPSPKRSTVTA